MPRHDDLDPELRPLLDGNHRGRLVARGLARGMIWRDGRLPEGAPDFAPSLSTDLLDHGYTILAAALRLRRDSRVDQDLDAAFRTAGEAIESAVRRGETRDRERGFHLTMAAAAFHLGHLCARSYCLLEGNLRELNLSTPEITLAWLMRRDLSRVRETCLRWLRSPENNDEGVAGRLADEESTYRVEDAVATALTRNFCLAIASFEFALSTGTESLVAESLGRLREGAAAAETFGHVPLWWDTTIALHLLDDLWSQSLHVRLPILPPGECDRWNELRSEFIRLLLSRKPAQADLWPSQLTAAERAVTPSDDLVVALPTSAGKTRIAELCILRCLADGKRVVYVTPLRALSAQVEGALAHTFRPLGFSVTSVYGASGVAATDVETLRSAEIVVATPEKLDFAARQEPSLLDDVGLIVLDEGHMIGFGEREIRYELMVQRLLKRPDADGRRIVCLSAIFTPGEHFDAFNEWIRSGDRGEPVVSTWRPTRQRPATLTWNGQAGRLDYTVEGERVFVPNFVRPQAPAPPRRLSFPNDHPELVIATVQRFAELGHSVLVYCPVKLHTESVAKSLLKARRQRFVTGWLDDEHAERIATARRIGREWLGDDHPAVRCLELGVGVHHGGLPRAFLSEVEQLLRERVLRVAISSPTLAQGVDLSFSVLVFHSIYRGDQRIEPPEFANVVGRVGRAFVDLDGIYVLPIFGVDRRAAAKLQAFVALDRDAKHRVMESGLVLLIRQCLHLLTGKLGIDGTALADYVLNNREAVDSASKGNDEDSLDLGFLLAELDSAILATVSDLSCSAEEVAGYLDQALDGSYWKHRVDSDPDEAAAQRALLNGRSRWLWDNSDASRRKGFFAASVGHEAGSLIAENADLLGGLLGAAEAALESGDPEGAAEPLCELAAFLFDVHPFRPKGGLPGNWRDLIEGWLCGQRLGDFSDPSDVPFIQEAVVYRLVWALEAVRAELTVLGELPDVCADGKLSTCLTFGVPGPNESILLQSGLASRLLACRLVREHQLGRSEEQLRGWLELVTDGRVDISGLPDDEEAEWQRFIERLRTKKQGRWVRINRRIGVTWKPGLRPRAGDLVRVRNSDDGHGVDVFTPDFVPIGHARRQRLTPGGFLIAGVSERPNELDLERFGPPAS